MLVRLIDCKKQIGGSVDSRLESSIDLQGSLCNIAC
jgi:hypothetical protein